MHRSLPSQRSSSRSALKPHPLPHRVPTLKLPNTLEPTNHFDYDHILTLLSTPISLLIQTLLLVHSEQHHRLTAAALLTQLSLALGSTDPTPAAPEDDLQVISQILHAHHTGKPPSLMLDSFILKSRLLRQLIEGSVATNGGKDQWEAVRRLREGVMRHVEQLEATKKVSPTPEVSGRSAPYQTQQDPRKVPSAVSLKVLTKHVASNS